MSEKRTNALTNRPELLGDCHDQSADWSRNDSSNKRINNNLSFYQISFLFIFWVFATPMRHSCLRRSMTSLSSEASASAFSFR